MQQLSSVGTARTDGAKAVQSLISPLKLRLTSSNESTYNHLKRARDFLPAQHSTAKSKPRSKATTRPQPQRPAKKTALRPGYPWKAVANTRTHLPSTGSSSTGSTAPWWPPEICVFPSWDSEAAPSPEDPAQIQSQAEPSRSPSLPSPCRAWSSALFPGPCKIPGFPVHDPRHPCHHARQAVAHAVGPPVIRKEKTLWMLLAARGPHQGLVAPSLSALRRALNLVLSSIASEGLKDWTLQLSRRQPTTRSPLPGSSGPWPICIYYLHNTFAP